MITKNKFVGRIFYLLFVLLLCSLAFSSLTFAQDSIEILSESPIIYSQDLSFKSCIDGTSIKHVVYCNDDGRQLSLPAIDFDDSCFVSSIDLDTFSCSDIEIQATYLKNGTAKKITEKVYPKKTLSDPKDIVSFQNWDGGWNTPSDTAYAIWILSTYGEIYGKQISEGLDWLKANRLEDEKCWSSKNGRCHLYETSRTLLFLKYAGINTSEKVYLDGLKWLESQMNYIEDSDWELKVIPLQDGNCTIVYDGSTKYNDDVLEDEVITIPITAKYESLINVSCENMGEKVYLYDAEGRNIFYNYFEENSDEFFDYTIVDDENETIQGSSIYRLPPACWSSGSKWTYCNRKTTLYSLLIDEMDDEKLDLAKEWLEEELRSATYVGKYLSTEDSIIDSAIMLYDFDFDEVDNQNAILDWLVHTQNNDGSWGDGDTASRVVPTGFSLLALHQFNFSGSKEVYTDATNWLSKSYPKKGWNSFEQDAISFILLRDSAKKYLKINQTPVKINSDSTKITLENPTGINYTNVTYLISGKIKDKVSTDLKKSFGKFEKKSVSLVPKKGSAGTYTGILTLFENDESLLSVPLIYTEKQFLEISPAKESFLSFSNEGSLVFRISTNAPFACTLQIEDDAISARASWDISVSTSALEIPFILQNLENEQITKTVSGNFVCTKDKSQVEIPFSFDIKNYNVVPFSVNKNSFFIGEAGKNVSFEVINNIDESLDISLRFDPEAPSLTLGAYRLSLDPKESSEVKITNLAIPLEGITTQEEGLIILSAHNHVENVAIQLEVLPLGVKRTSIWPKLVFFAIVFSLLIGGWWYYENKIKPKKDIDNGTTDDTRPLMDKLKDNWKEFKIELREILPEKYQKLIPRSKEEIEDEKRKQREEIERAHLKDMVAVMRKLGKSDKDIKEKLVHEGLTEEEIKEVLRMVEMDDKLRGTIEQEHESLEMIKSLESNDNIKNLLQEKGFSKKVIDSAFGEIEKDLEKKEKQLKKESGQDVDE